MSQRQFQALVQGATTRDERSVREAVWSALVAERVSRQAEAGDRERVLRALLDDAHARIRSLQAALQRLGSAVSKEPLTDPELEDCEA